MLRRAIFSSRGFLVLVWRCIHRVSCRAPILVCTHRRIRSRWAGGGGAPSDSEPYVLTGDYNLMPSSTVYRLLTTGAFLLHRIPFSAASVHVL